MGGLIHPDVAAKAGQEALPLIDDGGFEETFPQIDDGKPETMAPSGSIRKVDLPIIIQGSTYISRPDSGSEENIHLSTRLRLRGKHHRCGRTVDT